MNNTPLINQLEDKLELCKKLRIEDGKCFRLEFKQLQAENVLLRKGYKKALYVLLGAKPVLDAAEMVCHSWEKKDNFLAALDLSTEEKSLYKAVKEERNQQ